MSGDHFPALRHEPAVGHLVRTGDWYEQGVSTYRRAAEAIVEAEFERASELGQYTVTEASEANELYGQWLEQLRAILVREGVPPEIVTQEEARVVAHLSLADGTPPDLAEGWDRYCGEIDRFTQACTERDAEDAAHLLERARSSWQDIHDRTCDRVYGLLDVVAKHLGEERIGDVWDELMQDGYRFYERYDVNRNPWTESFQTIMHVLFEGMRGHLTGPDRLGDLEVVEEPDRWGVRFNPCGSGGRTYRGDEAGPPRMEPPFNYAVTTEEHPWAWNKRGICLYCVHCCQLMERHPIRAFGYPVRVVEPPTWPEAREGGRCTWWVYKDPALVPPEVYERIGERKPASLGSASQRQREQ